MAFQNSNPAIKINRFTLAYNYFINILAGLLSVLYDN